MGESSAQLKILVFALYDGGSPFQENEQCGKDSVGAYDVKLLLGILVQRRTLY